MNWYLFSFYLSWYFEDINEFNSAIWKYDCNIFNKKSFDLFANKMINRKKNNSPIVFFHMNYLHKRYTAFWFFRKFRWKSPVIFESIICIVFVYTIQFSLYRLIQIRNRIHKLRIELNENRLSNELCIKGKITKKCVISITIMQASALELCILFFQILWT